MRSAAAFALVILLSPFAFSQAADSNPSGAAPSVKMAPPAPQMQTSAAQTSQPPNYSNFSIMLVNPAGGAVVLMHNRKNALEYVDVAKTKEAFAAGYVPARAAEFAEMLTAIRGEIAQLKAENARLQQQQARQVNSQGPSLLSPADRRPRDGHRPRMTRRSGGRNCFRLG